MQAFIWGGLSTLKGATDQSFVWHFHYKITQKAAGSGESCRATELFVGHLFLNRILHALCNVLVFSWLKDLLTTVLDLDYATSCHGEIVLFEYIL